MTKPSSSTFFYHATGNAIGGAIHRPFCANIDGKASAALPIVGGYSTSEYVDFSFKQVVSYKRASTQLAGSFNAADDTYNTLVTVVIENLNILDTVTADRIVTKLSSQHHKDEAEGHIIPLGSKFEGLRIAGHRVDVHLDHELFCECDTFAGFKQRYKKDKEFRKKTRKQFLWGDYGSDTPQFLKDRFKWHTGEDTPPEAKGIAPCHMVKAIEHDQAGTLKTYGNLIMVPQFGQIYLGEMILQHGTRQLTMMRLELGSPIGGSITVGGVTANGTGWPPVGP